ncbi:MAG: protein kinase [Pirellulales bacterium]
MNKRVTSTTAGTEPIPGYLLRKRLGAGGYGEVWLADAPGGLQKAIKLIYGSVDDSRAANELRSLERIRSVHHPFLLSLERIEIVDGKVVIVTELAESSLQDRFQASRRQGGPGIPRNELLDFLRDSADALDFLAQKHNLQHLDVKPGNLLIIANHIKVADFGLVKDLQDPNQSLVSGLTPSYSAPEVFDGRPDFRSDQYSLAIVYMEMLTGRLPFNGRNAGELARQHLTQAPNLDPLPPADRSIVQRALSKNPLDRYATCRQFVDQLLKVRSSVVVPTLESPERNSSTDELPSKSILATDTRNWTTSRKHRFAKPIPIRQIANEWNTPRAMFIGLGGTGVLALREIRNDILHNVDSRFTVDDYAWLALDSSREQLEVVVEGGKLEKLPVDNAILLPIQTPQAYRKLDIELFAPLSRRWLYNIPKTQRTEGVRPIATLALIANYPALVKMIENQLHGLMKQHQSDVNCQSPLKVYVTASLHGGTGSAWLAEVGLIVRRAFAKHGFNNYRLSAVVSAGTTAKGNGLANLQAANAIVSLSELTHFMNPGCEKPNLDYRGGLVTSSACPFDWVSLVDGGLLEDISSSRQTPKKLARAVSLDIQTLCAAALNESRQNGKQVEFGWLRAVRCESVQNASASTPEALAQVCSLEVLNGLLDYMTNGNPSGKALTSRTTEEETTGNPNSTYMPLTKEAIDELIRKTLREMALVFDGVPASQVAELWAVRLLGSRERRQMQLATDLDHWQKVIIRQVQMRVYNWRQIERIQLEVIQGLLKYLDTQLAITLEQLRQFPQLFPKKHNIAELAQAYVGEFTKACVNFMEQVRSESQELALAMQAWRNEIIAGASSLIRHCQMSTHGLTPQTQTLCAHVRASLEDQFFTQLIELLNKAPEKVGLPNVPCEIGTDPAGSFLGSAAEVLGKAKELIVQSCKEMGINASDLQCRMYHHSTVSFDELRDTAPSLADGGGEIVRMIVTNEEQLQTVDSAVKELGIAGITTLLPGTPSLGTQIVCDAGNLSLPFIVSSLWRPTGATLSLAERLRTRVDIEWQEVSGLLNWHRNIDGQQAVELGEDEGCRTEDISILMPVPDSVLANDQSQSQV